MNLQERKNLESDIERLELELKNKQAQLYFGERNCQHCWGKPIYDPIRTEGYHFQSDPEGTMGIDRQLPCYIPPTTTNQWKRVCSSCGKTQTTQRVKSVQQGGLKTEVPDFGD